MVDEGIELVPLREPHVAAGGTLQRKYDKLNLLDAVQLGTVDVLDETLVSADTPYPSVDEIETVDPREL